MSLNPSPISEGFPYQRQREDKVRDTTSQNLAHIFGSSLREMTNLMAEMVSLSRDNQRRSQEQFRLQEQRLLQARDRIILVQLPTEASLSEQSLKSFVSSLCKKVWSAAFNLYSRQELSFEHTKVYASEQILRNIVKLCEHFSLGRTEFAIINQHIQNSILNYMWHKYPMTLSPEVHRSLNKAVKNVDNTHLPIYNYLYKAPFTFQYRQNGEYNDLIMKTINQVLKRTHLRISNFTVYERFESRVNELLELIMDSDYMEEKQKEDKQKSNDNLDQCQSFGLLSMTIQAHLQKKETIEENMRGRDNKTTASKAKYREKVQSYTTCKIGKKLPESTRPFSEQNITSHNLTIENPQVLRLLEKWCEELQRKFTHFEYVEGLIQKINNQNKGAETVGDREMQQAIVDLLRQEKKKIDAQMQELIQNNYMMESKLMKRELSMEKRSQIQPHELIAARYSLGIVNNLHSYTIKYLNRLIHGLLTVSAKLSKQFSTLTMDLNIITLQIMDLFRCKYISGQKQIIRIYYELIRQAQTRDSNLSLIRVVNRLQKGTNDILVNVKYRGVLCQIQLAVKAKNSSFIQYSNSFNHYFYEIKRALFGPLTELCSIWKCLDPRFDLYSSIPSQIHSLQRLADQNHCQNHFEFKPFFKPFICNICFNHYYDNVYIKNHSKCQSCDYWICAQCQIVRSDCLSILNAAFRKEVVAKCQKLNKEEQIPEYGICIRIHCYETKIEPFKKYIGQGVSKIMGVKSKKIYEIYDLADKESIIKFKQKYLVFKIQQEYGRRHIKIDEEQVKEYLNQQKLRQAYLKHSDKICINQELISTQQLAALCSLGNSSQRLTISQIQLIGNQLHSVDQMIKLFPNLITLNLSGNELKKFQCLTELEKLESLIIDSNKIQALPQQLWSLLNLRELSVAKNQIRVIPCAIGQLRQLRTLCLNRNKIEQLPEQIGGMRLQSLNLSDNQIKKIQEQLCSLGQLQVLQLQNNKLTYLNPRIKQLKQLRSLNLSHNQICSFPEDILLLSLGKLNLSFNRIEEVPASLNQLSNLKQLNISHNELHNRDGKRFPEITMLWDLLHLDLSHNSLEIMPRFSNVCRIGFEALQFPDRKLKYLSLANNKLSKIQSFQNLQRLEELYLNCNQLQHLPESVNRLTSLLRLHLQINNLRELPCLVLNSLLKLVVSRNQLITFEYHKLKELEDLQISDNQLTQLGYNYMPKLNRLNISRNLLEALELSEYQKIKTIIASHNKIKQLPLLNPKNKPKVLQIDYNLVHQIPESLQSLTGLTVLNIAQNQITALPPRLQKLASLENRSLELSGNPIQAIGCWQFLLQKSTPATLKYLEGCRKDMKTEQQKQEMAGRDSSLQEG